MYTNRSLFSLVLWHYNPHKMLGEHKKSLSKCCFWVFVCLFVCFFLPLSSIIYFPFSKRFLLKIVACDFCWLAVQTLFSSTEPSNVSSIIWKLCGCGMNIKLHGFKTTKAFVLCFTVYRFIVYMTQTKWLMYLFCLQWAVFTLLLL